MASVEKYKFKDSPRLLSHCNRTQKNQGAHIDKERTYLNFDLNQGMHPGQTDYQFAKARIYDENVKMMKREDVKSVCSWIVTLPDDLCHHIYDDKGTDYFTPNDSDECRDFFQNAYNFFKERHGAENVISANVHMDENKPHMHFIFTPIVRDKDGKEKVCAKEALKGCYGAKFQIELQDYISEHMGIKLNMVKQETVDYERNVKELKKKTLNEKYARLSREIIKTEEQLERKKYVLAAVTKAADDAKVDIKTSSSRGYTVMKDSDWRYVQEQLKLAKVLKTERQEVLKAMRDLEESNSAKENDMLKLQVHELEKENLTLEQEKELMEQFMSNTELRHGKSVMEAFKEETEKQNIRSYEHGH